MAPRTSTATSGVVDGTDAPSNGREPGDRAVAEIVLRPVAAALHATDLRERWPAQAAESLAVALSVDRIAFASFDARGRRERDVVVLDRSDDVPLVAELVADFQERFAGRDPFLAAPRRRSREAIAHGWPALAALRLDRRELATLSRRWGIVDALTIHLHHGGRLAAHLLLWRRAGQPPFRAGDLRLARTTQPLLTTSYAAVLQALPQPTAHASEVLEAAGLSEREREIARLVAQGATNKQIAEAISRSPATVNTHVTRVLAKLGLGNRTQLAWVLAGASR